MARFPVKFRPLTLAIAALVLGACNPIYQLDIQQGNLFTKVQVESLHPGMTRRQVQLTMGSPSVHDPFTQSRWDYISTFRRRNGKMDTKTLTVFFDGDNVNRVEGDYFAEDPNELIAESRKYKRQYPDDKRSDEDKKKKKGDDSGT